jgi:hypothetical protein
LTIARGYVKVSPYLTVNRRLEVMNKSQLVKDAKTALHGLKLDNLIPFGEYMALSQGLLGEEKNGIAQIVYDTFMRIKETPQLYGQDGKKDPIVHFKYFKGSWTWFVTEYSNAHDAFGFVTSNMCPEGELGYLDISEIVEAGGELDMYWGPKPLSEAKKS